MSYKTNSEGSKEAEPRPTQTNKRPEADQAIPEYMPTKRIKLSPKATGTNFIDHNSHLSVNGWNET